MKHLTLVVALMILAPTFIVLGTPKPRSSDELIAIVKEYHAVKDIEALMSLRYSEGYPAELLAIDRKVLSEFVNKEIISITLAEIPTEMMQAMAEGLPYKDLTLIPNIPPLKIMNIELSGSGGMRSYQTPIGEINGIWYFTATKPKPK